MNTSPKAVNSGQREALEWTSGTLQSIVSGKWRDVKEQDRVSIGGVVKTISQVLDMADAALARAASTATATDGEPVAQFDDPRVQAVYGILCGDDDPPMGEHWEGWVSRRIVDSLAALPLAEQSAAPMAGETADENAAFDSWFKTAGIWNDAITRRAWKAACAWMRSVAVQTCESVAAQSKNSLFRSGAKICAGEIRNPVQQCDRAPEGWQCSRVAGHDGPCAASQVPLPRASEQADVLSEVLSVAGQQALYDRSPSEQADEEVTLTDSRIKEVVDGIDFGTLVTADDFICVIARAIEREVRAKEPK